MWDQSQFDHEMVYHQAAGDAMRSHSEMQKKRIPTWFSERQLAQLRETGIRLRKYDSEEPVARCDIQHASGDWPK